MSGALPFLLIPLGLCGAMAGAWAVQRSGGSSGWIDSIWSLATGGACIAFALVTPGSEPSSRAWLVAALAAAWSLRLGIHIARRSPGHDDPRYAHLKREWGSAYQARLFRFLQIQALAGAALALAAWLAARNPEPGLTWLDAVGALVAVAGLVGEGVADSQLAAFKANPANRGGINDRGLWGWSRHPNYFFECLFWLGIALIALSPSGVWAWGWAALGAPAFMVWLLTRVSGIPPLEAHMERSRGRAWRDYAARTSPFLPLPPRASAKEILR